MPDHDEQMMSPSPQEANRHPVPGKKAAARHTGGSHDAAHAAAEESGLSRIWGGAGIPVRMTLVGRDGRHFDDMRLLWGLAQGGDGFSLLPYELTKEGDDTVLSFNIPPHALPGVYAIQLQNGSEFRHRFQFVVTAQDPPETSPFRQLRTDPIIGGLRMYLTFNRYRKAPGRAVEEIAGLMKKYDTFYVPQTEDPEFQEVLAEQQTADEKREKFAKWLVKNQLRAERDA